MFSVQLDRSCVGGEVVPRFIAIAVQAINRPSLRWVKRQFSDGLAALGTSPFPLNLFFRERPAVLVVTVHLFGNLVYLPAGRQVRRLSYPSTIRRFLPSVNAEC